MMYCTDIENLGLVSKLDHFASQNPIKSSLGSQKIVSFDGGSCQLKCSCLVDALELAISDDFNVVKSYKVLVTRSLPVRVEGNSYWKSVSHPLSTHDKNQEQEINSQRILKVRVTSKRKEDKGNDIFDVDLYCGKLTFLGTEEDRNLTLYGKERLERVFKKAGFNLTYPILMSHSLNIQTASMIVGNTLASTELMRSTLKVLSKD